MRPAAVSLSLLLGMLSAGCYEDPDSKFPDRDIEDNLAWVERTATYGMVQVYEGSTLRIIRSDITIEEDLRVWGNLELIDSTLTFRREDVHNTLMLHGQPGMPVELTATRSSVVGADGFDVEDSNVTWTGGSLDSEQMYSGGGANLRFEDVAFLVGNVPENDDGLGAGFNVVSGRWWISNSTFNDDVTFHVYDGGHMRLVGCTDLATIAFPDRPLGASSNGLEEADWVRVRLVDLSGAPVANRTVTSLWLQTMEDESSAVTDADGRAWLEVVHRDGLLGLRDPHAILFGGPSQGQPHLAQARQGEVTVVVPDA